MNCAQMIAHCRLGIQSPLGEIKITPPPFPFNYLGSLFKSQATSKGIFAKNAPTAKELKIVDGREFEKEKKELITYINKINANQTIKSLRHVFYGNMTAEQWGMFMYKHLNHHLTQFGV